MNIWGRLLKIFGWKVDITAPRRDKCVICVAPHTSNWDFIIGLAAYRSLGRDANFLMKKSWFFFPLGSIFRAFGGIPVDRRHGGTLTEAIVEMFRTRPYVNLAVTPEGTRSLTEKWHTGFLYIAYGAEVPLQLGVIDFSRKTVEIKDELPLTGDVDIDMRHVREFYSRRKEAARYPWKFK